MKPCGICGLEIHPGETGVRHFGFFTAHSENRCVELLRAALATSNAEILRLETCLAASESALAISEQQRQEAEGRIDGLLSANGSLQGQVDAMAGVHRKYEIAAEMAREARDQLAVCKEALEYYANHKPHPPNRARRALSTLPAIASKRDAVVEAAKRQLQAKDTQGGPKGFVPYLDACEETNKATRALKED